MTTWQKQEKFTNGTALLSSHFLKLEDFNFIIAIKSLLNHLNRKGMNKR